MSEPRGSKATHQNLAICGNAPAFSEKLYVNRPYVGKRDVFFDYVNAALDRYWLTNDGPLVQELEERLARLLNVAHCVVTCNGTIALALLIQALELQGEVIIPSFSFISTAHVLLWQNLDPVFCDIDPTTWNIDPGHCEALITDRTTAIIGTHLWGRACDTQRLEEIARRRRLYLIFDAAHAFGCTHQGGMIGRFGDAEVFSFHATKVFHTFEGGAVTTNDANLATRLRAIRNFGFMGFDRVETLGTNAKMPEVCAAMGLANLQSIEHVFEENQRTYERYRQGLKGIPGLRLLRYDPHERHNYQYVVLNVEEEAVGLSRDQLIRILHAENVIARRYFYPGNHRMEPYRTRFPGVDQRLPHTNRIAQRVLLLPGGTGVTKAQILETCAILRLAANNAPALRTVLESTDSDRADSQAAPELVARRTPLLDQDKTAPTVEIRIPISANEKFLRMLHYFLESLQMFGGPLGRSAHCVVSVSADEPRRDLAQECSWAAEHSVEFQWVDRDLFERLSYCGTVLNRFYVQSEADVVIFADADILVAGDFDRVIWDAYHSQRLLGFIAHCSPFGQPDLKHIPSHRWWNWIFEEAELPKPQLNRVHTGWGLMSKDTRHRCCPDYFNYGFVLAPRQYAEHIGETFEEELKAVDRVVESWFKPQIANTLACVRHRIPCGILPINYNFPLHVHADQIRALNPDPEGANSIQDVKIAHYLPGGEIHPEHFATRKSLEKLLR
ncbi:MAG: aminotransferase class I/II-fold pyridoxal phosphate-dependent enzyme, partial [Chloroflexi bacterium]|nr:aminotransferase class I/II-fold pyridoxal phosphate-dependent enzyme [Chloroflexota bacterium]